MRWRRRALLLSPLATVVLVVVADLSLGRGQGVSGLSVVAPLTAANLVGPLATTGYGALAVAVWAGLGLVDGTLPGVTADGTTAAGSLVRLVGIALGTGLAVAAAVHRRRRERRLLQVERVAGVVQRALLPPVAERLGPVSLAARYESSAADAAVGGDFYAATPTPWGVRITVGDVQGKGLDAVRRAAEVLGAFRERATEEPTVTGLVERMHGAAARGAEPGTFVTAVVIQVDDTGLMTLVSAGHPPPVLVLDGQPQLLAIDPVRPPLGLPARPGAPGELTRRLGAGDTVVLYTDGATEARRSTDRALYDETRLLGALGGVTDLPVLVDRLFSALHAWTRGSLGDDVAVLAFRYAAAEVDGDVVVAADPTVTARAGGHAVRRPTPGSRRRAPAAGA